jgi:hypothetical protein
MKTENPARGSGLRGQFAQQQSEAPMSALGQKQTLQGVRPMSALPPKADIESITLVGSVACDLAAR